MFPSGISDRREKEHKIKKVLAFTAALALAVVLAGCGSSAPASSSASESAMSTSDASASISSASASSSASSLVWTTVKTADEAAKGAGLDAFAAPSADTELSIGKLNSSGWEFMYAKDIAEANGGAGAAAIVVRKSKAVGDNTAELSDYTKNWSDLAGMAYAHKWEQKVGDTEVTCFGNVEEKASKMIWDQDGCGYSVLVLGQGDNWSDFGIEEDDVNTLVAAVIAANSEQKAAEEPKSEESQSAQATEPISKEDVEEFVFNAGLGELVSYEVSQDANGEWVVELTTRGADGEEYVSVLGSDGSVLENGYEIEHADDDEDEE